MSSSDEDSDSDGRLSPLLFTDPTKFFNNVKPKSVEDLLKESSSIIGDLKNIKSTFQPLVKEDTHESASQVEKLHGSADTDIEKPEPECSIKPSIVAQKFFGESGYLQFFSLKDLDLWKYGYCNIPTELLSKTEKTLLSWSPETLQSILSYALKGFSNDSFTDLNPIVHYSLRVVSVHEDSLIVDSCAKFVKRMLWEHLNVASISFSSDEIFSILFNHGVHIKNSLIFKVLPLSKRTRVKEMVIGNRDRQPQNWKYNLQAVLSCLTNVFQYCKFNKSDLREILLYLLMMCVDESIRASFLYLELQKCLCNVLLSICDNLWSSCVFWTLSTLASKTRVLSAAQKWGFVLQMTRSIPFVLSQGIQLRTQLAFVSIRHICGLADIRAPCRYPKEGDVMSEFIDFLESLPYVSRSLQNICIDFMGIFLVHYQFISEEEYTDVCRALKVCENSVTQSSYEDDSSSEVSVQDSEDILLGATWVFTPSETLPPKKKGDFDWVYLGKSKSEMTLGLQLVKIYTTLKLLPPNYKVFKEDSCKPDQINTLLTAENNTEISYPLHKSPKPNNGFKLKGETILSENCTAMNRSLSVLDRPSSSKVAPDSLTLSGKPSFQPLEDDGYYDKENYEAMDIGTNTTVVKKSDELNIQSSTLEKEMSATSLPGSSACPNVSMPNNPYSSISLDSDLDRGEESPSHINDDLIDQTTCSKKNELRTKLTSCEVEMSNEDSKLLPTAILEGKNSTDTASDEENSTDTASEKGNSTDTASEDEYSNRFSLVLSKRKQDILPKLSSPLPSESMSCDSEKSDLSAKQVSNLTFENPLKFKTSSKSSTEPSPDMLPNSNLNLVFDLTTDSVPSLKIGDSLPNKTNLSSNDISIANSASDSSPNEISSLELKCTSKSEVTSSKSSVEPDPVLPSISNRVSNSDPTTNNRPSLHIEDSLANETSSPDSELDPSITLKPACESSPNEVSSLQLESNQPCLVLPPDSDPTTDNITSLCMEDSLANETSSPGSDFSVTLISKPASLQLQYASKSETASSKSCVELGFELRPDSIQVSTSGMCLKGTSEFEMLKPALVSTLSLDSHALNVTSDAISVIKKRQRSFSESNLNFKSGYSPSSNTLKRPKGIKASKGKTNLQRLSKVKSFGPSLLTDSNNSWKTSVSSNQSPQSCADPIIKTFSPSKFLSESFLKWKRRHSVDNKPSLVCKKDAVSVSSSCANKAGGESSIKSGSKAYLQNSLQSQLNKLKNSDSSLSERLQDSHEGKSIAEKSIRSLRLSVDNRPDFVCKKDVVFVSSFCANKIAGEPSLKNGYKAKSLDSWQNQFNQSPFNDRVQDSREGKSIAEKSIRSLRLSVDNRPDFVCKKDVVFVSSFCANKIAGEPSLKNGYKAKSLDSWQNQFNQSPFNDRVQDSREGKSIAVKSIESLSKSSSNIEKSETICINSAEIPNYTFSNVFKASKGGNTLPKIMEHIPPCSLEKRSSIIASDSTTLQPENSLPTLVNEIISPVAKDISSHSTFANDDSMSKIISEEGLKSVSDPANPYWCPSKNSHFKRIRLSSPADLVLRSQLPTDKKEVISNQGKINSKLELDNTFIKSTIIVPNSPTEVLKSVSPKMSFQNPSRSLVVAVKPVPKADDSETLHQFPKTLGDSTSKPFSESSNCSSFPEVKDILELKTTCKPSTITFPTSDSFYSSINPSKSTATFEGSEILCPLSKPIEDSESSLPARKLFFDSDSSHNSPLSKPIEDSESSHPAPKLFSYSDSSHSPLSKPIEDSESSHPAPKLFSYSDSSHSPLSKPIEDSGSSHPAPKLFSYSDSSHSPLSKSIEDSESLHPASKEFFDSDTSHSSPLSTHPASKEFFDSDSSHSPLSKPVEDSESSHPAPKQFFDSDSSHSSPLSKLMVDSESSHPAPKRFFVSDSSHSSPLSKPIEDSESSHPAPKRFFDSDSSPLSKPIEDSESSHPAPKRFLDSDSSPLSNPMEDSESSLPAPKRFLDSDSSPLSKPMEDSESSLPAPKLFSYSDSSHSPLLKPVEDSESSHPAPKLFSYSDSSHSPLSKPIEDSKSSHPTPKRFFDSDSSHSTLHLSKPLEESESSHSATERFFDSDASHSPLSKPFENSESSHHAPKLLGDSDSSHSLLLKPVEDSESLHPAPKLFSYSDPSHSPLSKPIEDSESSHPTPKRFFDSDSSHSTLHLSKPLEESESSHSATKRFFDSDASHSPLSKPFENSESSHHAPKLLGDSDSSHSPLLKPVEDSESLHPAPKLFSYSDSSHSPLSKPIEDSESSHPTPKRFFDSDSSHSTLPLSKPLEESESLHPAPKRFFDSDASHSSPLSKPFENSKTSHPAPKLLGDSDSSHSFPLSKPIEDSESSHSAPKHLSDSDSSHSTPKLRNDCIKDIESLKPPSESSVDSSSICSYPVKEKTPESCAKTTVVKSELTLSPPYKPYPSTMHQVTLSSVSPLRISNVKSGLPPLTDRSSRKSVRKHSTQTSIVSFLVKKESSLEKPISSMAPNSNLIDNGVNSVAKKDSGPEKQLSEDSRITTRKRQNPNIDSPSKRRKSDESDLEVLFYRVKGPVNKTVIDLSGNNVVVNSNAVITRNHDDDDDIVVISEVKSNKVTVAAHDIITID